MHQVARVLGFVDGDGGGPFEKGDFGLSVHYTCVKKLIKI